MEEIAREMQSYQIEILAVQEIMWKGEEIIEKPVYTTRYAGQERRGRNGTKFMISKKMAEKVVEFKKINGRISYELRIVLQTLQWLMLICTRQ